MNIALTEIYAAASANFCGRYSLVRRLGLACAFACAAISTAAAAQYDHEAQRNGPQQNQPAPRPAEQGRQNDTREYEARAEEQRRQQQQAQQEQNRRNAEAGRRSGRLTPDERRDLRRQINEAGMDLYPNTPRR
jgi:hypothetical protein